jgi:Ser/Thr protein kinase RdoA (MazF antagonist)
MMKPYEELTKRGKARRLRKLALKGLEAYDYEVIALRLLGMYTNTLFRFRIANGDQYVLRICSPGWRTETDIRSEVMWLLALDRDTDIGAPVPRPARNGDFVVKVGTDGVPEQRHCLVMTWIPGTQLEKALNEVNLYRMGELFARMHEHSASFYPPHGFSKRKMQVVLARDEEDALFSAACQDAFTPETRAVIQRTRERVESAYERLYADPGDLRVIHHDLWHGNIKIHRGKLRPLDFEDTVWGYPVQDIAMALQDLMVDVEVEAYEPLMNAFRKGYESRLAWPETYDGQIDTFRAGRMLWVANYVARYERKYLKEHLDWLAKHFERYLEIGMIRK